MSLRDKQGAPFADLLPWRHITSAPYHKLSIDIACRHFPCPQKAFYFTNLKKRLVFLLGRHVELPRLRFFWTWAWPVQSSVVVACQSNANCSEVCETGWKSTHTEIVDHQWLLLINLKSPNTQRKIVLCLRFLTLSLSDSLLVSLRYTFSELCSRCAQQFVCVFMQRLGYFCQVLTNIVSCLQMLAKYWNTKKIYSNVLNWSILTD